jgi:hypothetical protein
MNIVVKNISQATAQLKLCLKLKSKNSSDFDFMHIHLAICSRYLPTYLPPSLITISQGGHGASSPLSLLLFPRDAHKDRSPRLPLPLTLPLSRASSLFLLLPPVSPLQPAQFPTHQEGIVSKGRTKQKKLVILPQFITKTFVGSSLYDKTVDHDNRQRSKKSNTVNILSHCCW